MNPESLDSSIQGALAALYPPFEATAPTVLSQLFRVIEESYQGDALQCLLDFLIPAKHILESVQQAACAPYSDVVFRCEGWPLCLRERVVIQLASLNPLLLRPGDFYLQAAPFADQAARIVLKSLLEEHQVEVEETPVPETSYPCIFTQDWLREVNHGRHGTPLRRCLLATDQGIVKVPWEEVARPEFVDRPRAMASPPEGPPRPLPRNAAAAAAPTATAFAVETRILPAKDGIAVSLRLVDGGCPRLARADRARPARKPVGWVAPNTWDSRQNRDMEGDYVDLVDFNKEKEALALNRVPSQPKNLTPLRPVRPAPPAPPPRGPLPVPCGRTARFSEEPCTPCMRRRLAQDLQSADPQSPDLRCRYRESYLAALQNPVTLERGEKMRAVLEEAGCPEEGGGDPGRAPPPPPPPLCCQPGRPCHAPAAESVLAGDAEEGDTGLRPAAERKGRPLSPSPSTASEPGARRFVLVQRSSGRSHSDVYPEMIPRVHVLQCKKSTAFGLVSPKTDRRRYGKQALIQIGHAEAQTPPLLINGQKKLQTPPGEGPRGPPGDHAPSPRSWGPHPASPQGPSSSLLHLGVACLPGSRDRTGRAVVEVYGDHKGWMSPFLSSQELCKLLLYFHSLPRKEVRDLGMTVVTDARKTPPPPAFYKSLLMVQEQALHAVHCVLMLVDKETNPRPERQPGLQMDVVTSLKALHKTVEGHQLTSALEGTYAYSHSDWLQLYQKLDPFVLHLQEASGLLQKAIGKFEGASKIDTVQDVQQCINEQKAMMREVLEDAQLVALQREGGAMLARLRREEFRFSHSEDYRDAMDLASGLYNQVEEQVHKLVMRSNQSLQHLDFLLKLRQLEGRFIQIREWFNAEGERRLLEAESVEDSLERVERTLDSFNTFLTQANEQKHQAMTLVTEAEKIQGASYPETEVFRTTVYTFKSSLADFLSRAELCRAELETMATLCRFCGRATELAKDCRQYLEQSQPGGQSGADVQSALQGYRERFAEFSAERFQEAKAQACSLKGSRGMRVWNVAWLRSQEVWGQLEERLSDPGPSQRPVAQPEPEPGGGAREEAGSPAPPAGASSPLCGPGGPGSAGSPGGGLAQDSDYGTVTCFKMSFRPDGKNGKGAKGAKGTPFSGNGFEGPAKKEERRSAGGLKEMTTQEPVGNVDFGQKEWLQQPFGRSLSEGSSTGSVRSEPPAPPSARTRGQPSPRILQAAQSFQISRHGSFCSEELGGGVPGDDRQEAGPCVRRCPATASLAAEEEGGSNNLKLQRIMEELLLTEREYVRSLGYIMAHYYPLLETPDVPQDLRGQRGRIFGNLEKLHDFHRHSFLKELEGCRGEPLRVGRCFLRHKESFNLYALYSKNKPQSDSILLHHGNDFFKKQQALSDKMDLSSYLLKPVQRISKYSLLLQDMLRECSGPQRGRQRAEIQAALQAVQFQLRHGNDLLTMDDIRNCDVNLKEQGQLIRQDEFMVSFRKKKCFRHVFLFQDLILFSKTKRNDVGNDVYIYKQSFKTSDVGMTHNSGDSGLCFEIWFRRRKFQDTYILQAERAEVKDDWTRDLERILWDQAVRSREIRMQERVFMGIGRKPFMDIQPSEAAICDRAVNCFLPGRECKASASSGVTSSLGDHELPRPDSIGSGSSSSTSSSSGRGSLPPTGFLCGQPQEGGHRDSSGSGALEDDLDRESEKIHLLMDSSESSGESVSGFSLSDRSCLSVTGGDADDTSSIISTLRPKAGHARQTSASDEFKKPTIAPKPQAHSAPQGPGQVQAMPASGKSTEV
ncbi:pleckstrin homology domain-containing family G member 4B isoform X2 [Anguilla anguilla]|uniref:pleckstrin homology domain-containing family G member 4B isoform X2 n=1 Tax=Anguilla anguilla TaxID=7936 RepID=UPI0015B21529|nr:pleckstrin homology domain-containing family G member 4B isoform X2 [Anguilla anguilla]